ncbi:uncharacterized protein J4E87_003813 [Alternaria ethzedia]|uniref:uncharacterized protein n=1 Tax=Alternaria ethzedia TaxID=181014 RepID=UPI0020C3B87E|nr:uncharacterized protein J4E87_003813 [Alternaria ethzedia]KAI4627251.1 hypothetical protein J4E87_003813 [Alternaria ethzedia]KAI4633328.1 hypothetical protein J4E80_000693 [Alternaria sp. BMP 0032]
MALEVLASDSQQALFRTWAAGSVFMLNIHDAPKSQFRVLAKLLNWVEGEQTWCTRWEECFGEEYTSRSPAIDASAADTASDLNDEDATASASTASDVVLKGLSTLAITVADTIHENLATTAITPSVIIPGSAGTPSSIPNAGGDDEAGLREVSIWSQFDGFVPKPKASFNREFWRLSKHMNWTREESRSHRIEIFNADWEAHIGSELDNLEHWQEFCRLCSMNPIPTTIPGCMEVLAEVLVNIYDLLDSQRTGAKVNVFDDFDDFKKYTLKGRTYPTEKAMADTFLPIFLKEILTQRNESDHPQPST